MGTALSKTPLVEAIFDLKWKDDQKEDYDLLIGELYSKLKGKYPEKELLRPSEISSFLMPFTIQHRFRKESNGYPLYQLGPGILSFNVDGKTYNELGCWTEFKKKIDEFIKEYRGINLDKYNSENVEFVQLRFVNKIEDPEMYSELKKYLDEKIQLKTDFDFENELSYKEELQDIKILKSYKIDSDTTLEVFISTITDSSRKIILDIRVKIDKLDSLNGGLESALDKAHTEIENLFNKITDKIKILFE